MPLGTPQNLLLSISAARGGYVASDAKQVFMSFSSVLFVERQSQGGPGGNVRARFLATSCRVARSSIKNRHTERAKLGEAVEEVVEILAKPK